MKNENPAFVEFWETHWRKHARPTDGRKSARDTFMAHVKKGADPQDIADGAAWFIRNLKDADRSFIPLAATWINRGAYEDMCLQERNYQQKRAVALSKRAEAEERHSQSPAFRSELAPKPKPKRDLKPEIRELLRNMSVGGNA